MLELFCGTKSFAKAAWALGHDTLTVDIDPRFEPDICADVLDLNAADLPGPWDFIWASPPCTHFSVMNISRNFEKDGSKLVPKSEGARNSIELVGHTIHLIEALAPRFWLMENPRATLRKMSIMKPYPPKTITYCQYGDGRMKPTDLFGKPPPSLNFRSCTNGDPCHVSAPRGSKNGTQGIARPDLRAQVPQGFCIELIEAIERDLGNNGGQQKLEVVLSE